MPDRPRRCIPPLPKPPGRTSGGGEERTYQIHTITPMFGGGAVAGRPDVDVPVRGSSIRGHLRFWWRATRGAAFANATELKQHEDEVWGSTEQPSRVWVEVRDPRFAEPKPCATWDEMPNRKFKPRWLGPFAQRYAYADSREDEPSPLPYVAFPFQGEMPSKPNAKPPARYLPAGGSFQLVIRSPPTLAIEVEAALWAWVNFGGLGARTRRGCGSLHCDPFSPARPDSDWFGDKVRAYGLRPEVVRAWPTLASTLSVYDSEDETLAAWQLLFYYYRWMRQGEGGRKWDGPKNPRRSYWPEPETIRKETGQRLPKHRREPDLAVPDDAAPRAGFGLPINTQFHPHQKGRELHDDPRDTAWVPLIDDKPGDRWASPLILKPLASSARTARPLVAVLRGPRIDQVALVEKGRDGKKAILGRFGPDQIRHPRLASYPNSPLAGAPKTGDAVDAFVALFEDICDRDLRRLFP